MSEEDDRTEAQIIREMSAEADQPMAVDPHDDRTLEFERTGLSRLRTSWTPEDAEALDGINGIVEREIMIYFAAAFQIMNEVYDIVREPVADSNGEVVRDQYGFPVWLRTETGAFIEDYSKLSHKDVEHFLFRITTRLFDWEQQAAQFWGESMFAKAVWEQRLAASYAQARENGGRTVEDRTQAARLGAYEERLFGIFRALLSRKADAVVASMTRLSQRLKDVLSA